MAFFSLVLAYETSCILFQFLWSFHLPLHHSHFWCCASRDWHTSPPGYKLTACCISQQIDLLFPLLHIFFSPRLWKFSSWLAEWKDNSLVLFSLSVIGSYLRFDVLTTFQSTCYQLLVRLGIFSLSLSWKLPSFLIVASSSSKLLWFNELSRTGLTPSGLFCSWLPFHVDSIFNCEPTLCTIVLPDQSNKRLILHQITSSLCLPAKCWLFII